MKLIICDTYAQLMQAIQMKLTIFKDEVVDVRISDHSQNAKSVAQRLEQLSIFRKVDFVETKDFVYGQSKLKNIRDIIQYNFGKKKMVEIDKYDEIIFYNLNLIVYAILDYYDSCLYDCVWSKMEEGLFSYETDFDTGLRVNVTRLLRKVIKRNDVVDKVSRYYCYIPELKKENGWEFIRIPSFKNNLDGYVNILNCIFDYNHEKIDEKYIFFASSSDIDGNPYGETELIMKLAEKLGDDLIVKIHPRDTRTVFSDNNIRTFKNGSVPWEVFQLNIVNEDKILCTVNSGAFISVSAVSENKRIKGYFLLDEIENKSEAFLKRESEIRNIINLLHNQDILNDFKCIRIEDL